MKRDIINVRIADAAPLPTLVPGQHLAGVLQKAVRYNSEGLTQFRYRVDVSALSQSERDELLEWVALEPQDFAPSYEVENLGPLTLVAHILPGSYVEQHGGKAVLFVDMEDGR